MSSMSPDMLAHHRNQNSLPHFSSSGTSTRPMQTNTEQPKETTAPPSPTHSRTSHTTDPNHFPIPQIQGVVPGFRHTHTSHSLPFSTPTTCDILQTLNTTSSPPTPDPTTQSSYPRPSPPNFLYPFAIVPYTTLPSTSCTRCPENAMADSPDMSLATTLPLGLKLLFLGTLCAAALGLAWTVVVCCIVQHSEAAHSDEEAWQSAAKRSDSIQTQHGSKEESKDTRDVANPFADPTNTHQTTDKSAALSSGIDVPPTPRYRRRNNAVPGSPQNPFLDPPSEGEGVRVERTEGEWTRARAMFFAEMEAVESEMRELSRGRVVDGEVPAREKRNGRSGVMKVVERGVEMVDGGVDDVVVAMARWTDDK